MLAAALALGAAEPPPSLPAPSVTFGSTPAQRGRLRSCALEWSRLKKSGEAAGKLWRDFWVECGKG